ncbi:M20/M25/M40 family metallo-hydrolase [Candidatus Neomarinimicrobiota bacterium]
MPKDIRRHLTHLFLQLTAIDATSGGERPVVEFIRNFLADREISIGEDDANADSNGSTGNVICEIGGGGEIVLLAHMDTAQPTADLKPRIQADRITSDGTTILGADDRAGIAVLLHTLEQAAINSEAYSDFTVVFTVCEETDLSGSKHLALDDRIRMGYALDSADRPGHFTHATYGAVRFIADVQGKAAHAGLEPEKGVDSIQAASRAISGLPTGRFEGDLTVNIGKISGGTAVNVVPARTTVKGEVRGRMHERVEETVKLIEGRFTTAVKELGASVDFTSIWDFEPYFIDPGHEVYKRLTAALEAVGLEPVPHVSAGGSDANSLNAKGIPALNIGIGAQQPHSNDEFIMIEDLVKTAETIKELLRV